MCVYCNMGDRISKFDPPIPGWHEQSPLIPQPLVPSRPWPIDKAKEYLDTLREIRDLEEKLGCPCEPNKADYIKLLEALIEKLKATP